MSILHTKEGKVVGFICGGGGWGMGITDFPDAIEEEFSSVYGFAMGGDPHDFCPDYDCNTPEEIANWEAAKAACKCGR